MSKPTIEERKEALLKELKALGVVRVVIDYSGSGDSGQVDQIAAFRADDPKKAHAIDALVREYSPEEIAIRVSDRLLGVEDKDLSDRLEQFAYDAIDASDLSDWCNNEGGGGIMTVCVAEEQFDSDGEEHDAGVISIRHYYNIVEQHDEHALL